MGWGKAFPAAEPVVPATPFCGDTPQRPKSESADGFSATG
jgi:hypothetical protein